MVLEALLAERGEERQMDFTLERFKLALASVGDPQYAVRTVIVGGTNGKGSTTLFLSSALVSHGYRVNTFLSPHLLVAGERFLRNLIPLLDTTLDPFVELAAPVARQFRLTYFETLALIYFLWSREVNPNFSVIEVGLGGRLDATNVTNPMGCVLTSIGHDHRNYLGETLPLILEEKMGILRPGVPLVSGISQPDLQKLVLQRSFEQNIPLHLSHALLLKKINWEGQTVVLGDESFWLGNPSASTRLNAGIAVKAVEVLFPEIGIETIKSALARVKMPGRFEQVQNHPRVILSGDHNPEGIASLLSTLRSLPPASLKILCAFSPDKPHSEMYQALAQISSDILVTCIDRFRKAMPKNYPSLGEYEPNARIALEKRLGECRSEDCLLVTGSLYLLGELLPKWRKEVSYLRDPLITE